MNELFDMALAENGKNVLNRQLSTIHGNGLFTIEALPAGTILCRRLGLRSILSARDKRAIIGIDGVDEANPDDVIFKNINHSCHPNTSLNDTGCLINFRHIDIGEEITIDYNELLIGSEWRLPCHCGYLGCRGIIENFI